MTRFPYILNLTIHTWYIYRIDNPGLFQIRYIYGRSGQFVFYKQIHGTAMGSPVSVVVANLVMEDLEMKALNTYANRPRMYYRYVDDTIAAIKKTNIDDFHQHLNSLNTYIQFTIERYKDTRIPFLDTLNFFEPDGL